MTLLIVFGPAALRETAPREALVPPREGCDTVKLRGNPRTGQGYRPGAEKGLPRRTAERSAGTVRIPRHKGTIRSQIRVRDPDAVHRLDGGGRPERARPLEV
jgi:hypothetical protein